MDLTTARDDQDVLHTEVQEVQSKIINTTVGRVMLNEQLPKGMPFVNGLLKKKGLQQLVQKCYLDFGLERTVEMLDALKNLGFTYATRSGLSIGIDDLIIPANKAQLVENARNEVIKVEQQYLEGAITNGERYNKIIAVWSEVTEKIADEMFSEMAETGSARAELQPGLHHGRLGRPRLEAADPPARRHARPDGEAVGRDHRDADHVELPRRPHRAAVLHLDARRAQGPGRHRAQDGRLGLPDAPSRGRGAGRHHLGGRLRHARRHRGAGDRRSRRDHRAAARPHRRPRDARDDHRPVHREAIVELNEEIDEDKASAVQEAGIEKVESARC